MFVASFMADLQVVGAVLASVRQMRGLTHSDAADELGISVDDLKKIEDGSPTLKQSFLRQMAKRYQVPYGTLFMKAPLSEQPHRKPESHRTLGGRRPQLSRRTLAAISDINEAIDSFVDLRELSPALVPVARLPKLTRDDDIEAFAAAERHRLGVDALRAKWKTAAQTREGWRAALEAEGIFVYFYKMPKTDCTGFSILDERGIPAICVNDHPELLEVQKTFTIAHEYCHLLLGKPGISDQERGNTVERFCNQFAAALLIPLQELRAQLPGGGPNSDWTHKELKRLANRFHVSLQAVALRIEETKLAREGFHDRKVREWQSLGLLAKRHSLSHPNVSHAERAARRFGNRHSRTVIGALDGGLIRAVEARALMGLKPTYFGDVLAALG